MVHLKSIPGESEQLRDSPANLYISEPKNFSNYLLLEL